MVRKRKLRASGSSGGHRVDTQSHVDWLTSLPDEVAHHILSFLDIKDLIRFGCVSNRCSDLILFTPTLKFNHFTEDSAFSCEKRLWVLSSLDRFLVLRGDNRIKSFHLRWWDYNIHETTYVHNEDFRMVTWIHNAVRCNVEVLCVEVYRSANESRIAFPNCVFRCASLRSLEVNFRCKILKAPSITSSSNLKRLVLKHVWVVDEGFFKWISFSCKCIKHVHLDGVYGIQNIIVESSSLESFKFERCDNELTLTLSISGEKLEEISIYWMVLYQAASRKALNIFAPNLKKLNWEGNLMNNNLGKLKSLETAELSLYHGNLSDCIFEILCSLCSVKFLTLHMENNTVLLNVLSSPLPFDNLCSLKMRFKTFLTDDQVQPMATLFRGTPNLRTLYIDNESEGFNPDMSGFNMKFWKDQKLAFISRLEDVTLELYSSNAIEFARYIMRHAQNLQKMHIVYLDEQAKSIKKLKKAKISNATVVFAEVFGDNCVRFFNI